MSSTIRILRFPLIILAGAFGGVGLIVGFVFILAHLIRLKSLGSPYLLPLYPFRGLGTAEGLLRLPFSQTAGRASFLRPKRNGAIIQTKRKKNATVRKNEKYFIMLFIIILIFQSGCTEANIVDTQRMIHIGGFDIIKDKKFRGTILYPDYTKGVQSKPETQSTHAGTIETISSLLNAKSPHTIAVGQMRVVLFGKAFGEHGLGDVINNLQRDPNIGRDVQLALVDGSAEELLKHVRTNGSLYLSELLEQNIKTRQSRGQL